MKLIHSILLQKEIIRQFSRFIVVGVLNTVISLGAFYLLYNLFSVNYTVSNLISYIVGVINSFFWNKHWVFHQSNSNRMVREGITFLLVFAISYGIQYISLWGMVERVGISPNWAQLPAMVIYTVVNYTLNRLVTFSNKRTL